jgi:8-oxo-dGTP pyrophosphatase MutT (NUDIX family)
VTEEYFAGGFLFHPGSRKILLQFRGSGTSSNPDTWCFLGGCSEDGDGGRPSTTWCREMHEELGITIDPEDVVPLCDYLPASNPFHRHIFYGAWPDLAEDFSIPVDEEDLVAVRWFTVEDALALPDLLADGTRQDLLLFQGRLGPA